MFNKDAVNSHMGTKTCKHSKQQQQQQQQPFTISDSDDELASGKTFGSICMAATLKAGLGDVCVGGGQDLTVGVQIPEV